MIAYWLFRLFSTVYLSNAVSKSPFYYSSLCSSKAVGIAYGLPRAQAERQTNRHTQTKYCNTCSTCTPSVNLYTCIDRVVVEFPDLHKQGRKGVNFEQYLELGI